MSGSRESGLWRWLAKARLTLRDSLHMTRVENSVAQGMPDVEGALRGSGQFWIELKSAARPARDGTPVRFKVRDAQVEWLRRRRAVGGRAWLLLQVGSGPAAERYLIRGDHARVVQLGVTEAWLFAYCAMRQTPRVDPRKAHHVVRMATEY